MSNRKLFRMKPDEIAALIDRRASKINEAVNAKQILAERREFAARVDQDFGYSRLKQATEAETVEMPADLVLLKSLIGIGVIPLSRASVERYKMMMARNIVNIITKMFGIPLMVSGAVTIIAIFIAALVSPLSVRETVAFPWGMIFGIGCFLTWVEHALIPRREWRVSDIKGAGWFTRDSNLIPREVFELATRVKEVLPKTSFLVHELTKDYGPWFKWIPEDLAGRILGDPDPFLEVRFGGESFYIAVWNEPGFDGKLMEVE
ncbi:MAG: hypothetical protein V4681_01085 [Patescibacteria group bacterium]